MRFDHFKALAAQKKLVKDNYHPYFIPEDGICTSCDMSIFVPVEHRHGSILRVTGWDVEDAATVLIAHCPHCNILFKGKN